tara:strand:+ start:870 stop:1661 length:792 start_codon:yes stop_codon:yes gene_type:complete
MIFRDIKFKLNIKFIFIKFIRGRVQNLFNKFGLKIVKYNDIYIDLKKLIGTRKKLVIFDIGAFTGNSIYNFNKLFDNSIIYSFEPSQKNFETLKKNTKFISNCRIENLAISNRNEKIIFYENRWGPTSSTKKISNNLNKKFYDKRFKYLGKNEVNKKYKVNSIKIDSYVENNKLNKIDILKIDTQGNEYDVLLGAKKILELRKVEFIIIEMIVDGYYQSKSNLGKIDILLSSHGFELYGIYDIIKQPKMQMHQLDALYFKKNK